MNRSTDQLINRSTAVSSPRVLVIGYGNPLRGDDGLGCAAAEELARKILHPKVAILALHQLTPELADTLSQVDLAVFLDIACDVPPGRMVCRKIVPETSAQAFTTHHVTPPGLLALAQLLYGRHPEAHVLGVGAKALELGERLSPEVAAALPEVIRQALALIATKIAVAVPP